MPIRAVCVAALLLIGPGSMRAVAQVQVVYDEDVTVLTSENLRYPAVAQSARVGGDVVVSVSLNDDGSVIDAVALSGPRLLVSAAVGNARKWRFKPRPQHRAIVVYEFRIVEHFCVDGAPPPFRVLPPNVASVSACPPLGGPDYINKKR